MTAPRGAPGRRLVGVDAARGVALVGMMAVHLLPLDEPGGGETLTGAVASGRASALFAVLAGVGIALSTGDRSGAPGAVPPPRDDRAHLAAAAGLLVRGALVALVGLWLVRFDPPIAVILAYYGLLFAVATPLLRLRAPALAAGAVGACVLAPVVSHVLRGGLPPGPGPQPGLGALAAPGDLVTTLALTGYYPVLTWTVYLLAGMAVGRLDLHRARTAVALLVGGAALALGTAAASALLLGPGGGAAVLGPALQRHRYGTTPTDTWWWLAVDLPHSGTPVDLAHTTGTALAVLGAALLLARAAPVLLWPLAAVGAAPLTLYTLHVVVASSVPAPATPDGVVLAWHVAGALAIGAGLRLARRRGPLEAVVSGASRAARRAVAGRAPAERTGGW